MTSLLDRIRTKADLETRRLQFRLQPTPAALDVERLVRTLADDPNVLFLCTGNICRSPFAERYLRTSLRDRSTADVSVDSAGLRTRPGRHAPERAVTVADEFGVALSDHRSKPATEAEIEWSDVVFVMDFHNDHYLRRQFGRRGYTSFFLGALAPTETVVIDDPHGQTEAVFRSRYDEITSAIDRGIDLVDGLDS